MTPTADHLLMFLDEPPTTREHAGAARTGSPVRVVVSDETVPTAHVRLPPSPPADELRAAVAQARRFPPALDSREATALETAHRSVLAMDSKARHDIANQLMVLSGYLELLEDVVPDGEGREFLRGALKAAGLVDRHVAFTRAYREFGTTPPAWQGLGGLLSARVELPADAVGVRLWADPLAPVAFEGLFEARATPGIRFRASFETEEDGAVLLIDDDGPALAERELRLLFEYRQADDAAPSPFLARHLLGTTGIGIEAEPSPAGGLRYRVTVPVGCYISGSGR